MVPDFCFNIFSLFIDMQNLKLITEDLNLDGVGQIDFGWDFDEEGYREWLADMEYKPGDESYWQYIRDCVEFDVEYFDNDTFHHMSFDTVSYDDIEDTLGQYLAVDVIKQLQNNDHASIETSELYNSQEFDLNNPQELNKIAMQLLNHGEYYKGCRGFILTNGVIVYTPAEHNQVSQIRGVEGTFDFIRKGNIRILNQSIDLAKVPTQEQRNVLRQVIASYSDEELFLDIMGTNGEASAHYYHPDWRFVIGEIDRYFSEGIKPQGRINESIENSFDGVVFSGRADEMDLYINGKYICNYYFTDPQAYPFIISNNELFIGNKEETHDHIKRRYNFGYEKCRDSIEGRIWVSAKCNEFNYAVISFWGCKNDYNVKPQVGDVIKKLRVNPAKVVIVAESDWDGEEITKPILFSEWNGRIHQTNEEEQKAKELHMMSAKEKHDNTGNFRRLRDKKIGQKLTNDKGEEMPMAKYHNLIYQESKGKKNITINEDQYNRLFKRNNKEIRISEEQYNRLFGLEN